MALTICSHCQCFSRLPFVHTNLHSEQWQEMTLMEHNVLKLYRLPNSVMSSDMCLGAQRAAAVLLSELP